MEFAGQNVLGSNQRCLVEDLATYCGFARRREHRDGLLGDNLMGIEKPLHLHKQGLAAPGCSGDARCCCDIACHDERIDTQRANV